MTSHILHSGTTFHHKGIGKTRLALLEVAAQLIPHFADGDFLVDRAPLAGYTHVVSMAGSFKEWSKQGFPVL